MSAIKHRKHNNTPIRRGDSQRYHYGYWAQVSGRLYADERPLWAPRVVGHRKMRVLSARSVRSAAAAGRTSFWPFHTYLPTRSF